MKSHEIKALRLEKNLSQEELGEVCGVGKTAVNKWEKGKTSPSGSALLWLQQLRHGIIVVSSFTELEVELMDRNVEAGGFSDRVDYLEKSLT